MDASTRDDAFTEKFPSRCPLNKGQNWREGERLCEKCREFLYLHLYLVQKNINRREDSLGVKGGLKGASNESQREE